MICLAWIMFPLECHIKFRLLVSLENQKMQPDVVPTFDVCSIPTNPLHSHDMPS